MRALGRRDADVLDELLDGRQVGQMLGIADQVIEGDQGVGLAAAVGQLQLAHGLVVLARQAQHHILGQLTQVEGGIGEGKELRRVLVDRPGGAHGHVVEVGGEDAER